MDPLSLDEVQALPATMDLMTAARVLGLGRTKAYELARSGEFPCRLLRFDDTYRVPTAELFKILGLEVPRKSNTTGDLQASHLPVGGSPVRSARVRTRSRRTA
jgi:hypothetical protein